MRLHSTGKSKFDSLDLTESVSETETCGTDHLKEEDMNEASNATAEAGFELFRSLAASAGRSDNIFISSYGIASALSLLLLGIKGSSKKELRTLLKIRRDGLETYHQRYVIFLFQHY